MAIKDYSTEPDMNTTISGINIAEGCAPSGINNAIRQLMADMKAEKDEVAAKDAEQDAAISAAQSSADAAQSSADAAQSSADAAQSSADAALAKEAVLPGTVIAWAANSNPNGYLFCNGAAVSRTTYSALFAAIGTTYGAGDGSTTFNLPNLTDKFIQGSGTAGTSKAAGLPNIVGEFRGTAPADYSGLSGAFISRRVDAVETYKAGVSNSGSVHFTAITAFNAAYGGGWGIYGNSSTVQPPALTMRYYIKY